MDLRGRSRGGARWLRLRRPRLVRVLAGAFVAMAGILTAWPGMGVGFGDEHAEPIRVVLSSQAGAAPAKRVSATLLYAANDPWKRYLANESVCPGGERTDVSIARRADTVMCLVNYARKQRGLRELRVAAILNGASERKAQAILRCRNFSHSPCGGDWTESVKSTGYDGLFGENLYLATGLFGAPRPTMDAWLNSTPHRENLFRSEWREQGLAVVLLDRFGDTPRCLGLGERIRRSLTGSLQFADAIVP